MSSSSKPRAVIVPGNGCPPGKVHASNWYGWMRDQLVQTGIFSEVVLRDMPDPFGAKESEWVPFLLGECGVDANTLIIGHSSGAEAAMRLMENNPVLGCVLVSACHTDLGIANEREAGYYNRPWQWKSISAHAGRAGITQFHSDDDPFIPVAEAQHVARSLALGARFHLLSGCSHFFSKEDAVPILQAIQHAMA